MRTLGKTFCLLTALTFAHGAAANAPDEKPLSLKKHLLTGALAGAAFGVASEFLYMSGVGLQLSALQANDAGKGPANHRKRAGKALEYMSKPGYGWLIEGSVKGLEKMRAPLPADDCLRAVIGKPIALGITTLAGTALGAATYAIRKFWRSRSATGGALPQPTS